MKLPFFPTLNFIRMFELFEFVKFCERFSSEGFSCEELELLCGVRFVGDSLNGILTCVLFSFLEPNDVVLNSSGVELTIFLND